jgi:hypothetical protein
VWHSRVPADAMLVLLGWTAAIGCEIASSA